MNNQIYDRMLYRGTAKYYNKYRPIYPESVVKFIVESHHTNGELLLDMGCATGAINLQLHSNFKMIVGYDIEPEMIEIARVNIKKSNIYNVKYFCSEAEYINFHREVSVCLFGASLHWMDQELVLKQSKNMLAKGGSIVLLAPSSIWRGDEPWKHIIRELLSKWLGPRRRAGSGYYIKRTQTHEEILKNAGLKITGHEIFSTSRTMDFDDLLGYLYSMSCSSIEVFGNNLINFKSDLENRLSGISDGKFVEDIQCRVWSAM